MIKRYISDITYNTFYSYFQKTFTTFENSGFGNFEISTSYCILLKRYQQFAEDKQSSKDGGGFRQSYSVSSEKEEIINISFS